MIINERISITEGGEIQIKDRISTQNERNALANLEKKDQEHSDPFYSPREDAFASGTEETNRGHYKYV